MNAGMMDQCIAVAKPCGYESHFITTIAAPLLPFINSWCLEIGAQYALLMRANKPETAVQSSALFLLASHDHAMSSSSFWDMLLQMQSGRVRCKQHFQGKRKHDECV